MNLTEFASISKSWSDRFENLDQGLDPAPIFLDKFQQYFSGNTELCLSLYRTLNDGKMMMGGSTKAGGWSIFPLFDEKTDFLRGYAFHHPETEDHFFCSAGQMRAFSSLLHNEALKSPEIQIERGSTTPAWKLAAQYLIEKLYTTAPKNLCLSGLWGSVGLVGLIWLLVWLATPLTWLSLGLGGVLLMVGAGRASGLDKA